MRTVILNHPAEYVNDSILNTIKVINDYKLDKSRYDGFNRIWHHANYIDFSSEINSSVETKLILRTGDKSGRTSIEQHKQLTDNFLYNLDSVLSKKVVLPANILNIDPYKTIDAGQGILQILILIAAILAIAFGAYTFLKI